MTLNVIPWTLFIILIGLSFPGLQHQVQARSEEDSHFEDFLNNKLAMYVNWLSGRDPLAAITESVNLKSNPNLDDGVEADLTIKNYYMSGHSKPNQNIYDVLSQMEIGKTFKVTERHYYTDSNLIFEGDYTVNGTIFQGAGSDAKVPFEGQGKWRLEAYWGSQSLTIANYSVTKDDYVDLDASLESLHEHEYELALSWTNAEVGFEGLTIKEENFLLKNRTASDELNKRIQLALAETYERFLSDYQYPIKQQPYKRLLVEFWKEIFSTNKYSDIIAGRALTSSAPRSVNITWLSCGWISVYISFTIGLLTTAKLSF